MDRPAGRPGSTSTSFANGIDKGDRAIARAQRARESDLLMGVRLMKLDAAILGKALEQLNALPEQVVAGVVSDA